MESSSYNVLDLFCGCEGLYRAFIDAGFKVSLGVDFDDAALRTFAYNPGETTAMKLDLFNLENVDAIKRFYEERNLKVEVGSRLCESNWVLSIRSTDHIRKVLYLAWPIKSGMKKLFKI